MGLKKINQQTILESVENPGAYRDVYRNAPVAIIEVGLDLKVRCANPAFQQLLNYTESELQDFSILDFTHTDDRTLTQQHINNAATTLNSLFKYETRYIQNKGDIIQVAVTARLVPEGNGRQYILAFVEDISLEKEQAKQIQKLNEDLKNDINRLTYQLEVARITNELLNIGIQKKPLNEKLSAILDILLNNQILKLRQQGAFFLVNDGSDILKMVAHKDLAKPLISICSEVKFGHCLCGRAAKEKKILFTSCVEERHENRFNGMKDHGHFNVPIFDSNGSVIGVLVTYLDHNHQSHEYEFTFFEVVAKIVGSIINQEKLNSALEQETAKLMTNMKLASLGEMAAGMAHEINNPLAIIVGNIELLKRFRDDPVKFELKADKIIAASERITKIISALRQFSLSTENQPNKLIQLSKSVEEVLNLVKGSTSNKGISIEIAIDSNLKIEANEIEIEQVLINLISNSIYATKELNEKWIKLVGFEENDYVVIQIIDSGTGISKEIEQKLFQPFFTTKPIGQGTGLGLSTTMGILKKHGASISLNRKFKTTCFEMRFPKPNSATNKIKDVV